MKAVDLTQHRYIPKDSTPITREGVNGIVYTSKQDGKLYAIGYSGKRGKSDFYYRYLNEESRSRAIANYFDGLAETAKMRVERAQARKVVDNPFKVGDILHYSWGYDQTNCEFWEVTQVKTKTVTIRQIASQSVDGTQGFMSESRVALPGRFLADSKPLTKRVQAYNNHYYLRMEFGSATLWDGRPEYNSWYA